MSEYSDADGSLIDDLQAAGYPVRSMNELMVYGVQYRRAVPILLGWLPRLSDLREKEMVVRALTVRWAKPEALDPLIAFFREVPEVEQGPGAGLRWAVGNALDLLWDDSRFDDLAALVRDRSYGDARQMIVMGMGKSKDPRAIEVLLGVLDDDSVVAHAIGSLGRLRAVRAREAVEPFLNHSRPFVRKEAKKALERIDAAIAKSAQ